MSTRLLYMHVAQVFRRILPRLYGITTTQTFVYYQRQHADQWVIKSVVSSMYNVVAAWHLSLTCSILGCSTMVRLFATRVPQCKDLFCHLNRALDTFDMFLVAHVLYFYLITHYGDPASLTNPIWSVRTEPIEYMTSDYVLGFCRSIIVRMSRFDVDFFPMYSNLFM